MRTAYKTGTIAIFHYIGDPFVVELQGSTQAFFGKIMGRREVEKWTLELDKIQKKLRSSKFQARLDAINLEFGNRQNQNLWSWESRPALTEEEIAKVVEKILTKREKKSKAKGEK